MQNPDGQTKATLPVGKFRERALETLRRVGYEADDVSRLSDKQLRVRVAKAEHVLNVSAQNYAEAERLRNAAGNPASKEGQGSLLATDGAPKSAGSVPQIDYDKLAEPFTKFDPDLGVAARASFEAVTKPLLQELASLKAQVAQGREAADSPQGGQEARSLIEQKRGEMSERFPDLADNDSFKSVAMLMSSLNGSPALAHLANDPAAYAERLMEMAARAAGMDEVGEDAQPTAPQGVAQQGMVELSRGRAPAAQSSGPVSPGSDPWLRQMADSITARFGNR